MKNAQKSLIVGLVFSVVASITNAASVISWASLGNGGLLDSDSSPLNMTSDPYLVLLFKTAGTSTIGFDSATQQGGAGETLVASFVWNTSPFVYGDGDFYADLQPIDFPNVANVLTGAFIYSVVINSSSQGSATMYSILDGGSATSVTLDGASNFGYTLPDGNTWQPTVVPEPSTVGLLLVGAGLVAFRRMRRS